MKSVGEVMAIGRTFKESLQKALRSLEIGSYGFESRVFSSPEDYRRALSGDELDTLRSKLRIPNADRLWYLADALRAGFTLDEIHQLTWIDPWFLHHIKQIVDFEQVLVKRAGEVAVADENLRNCCASQAARLFRPAPGAALGDHRIRRARAAYRLKVRPVYKLVDTCAAEFEAYTPYLYSTYETENEAAPTDRKKIMILGGGPNRIGQGIEFDYCCVHGVFALAEDGFETIMVNCNPETVSTDYDTSDRLYFEPLTLEDVLDIVDLEQPDGVIVQFGGQTPLNLAVALEKAGVPIIGTSPDAIDRAEDRERFQALLHKLGLLQPENGLARSFEEAEKVADRIGYPVLVRPSYVLGGRAMEIVYDGTSCAPT